MRTFPKSPLENVRKSTKSPLENVRKSAKSPLENVRGFKKSPLKNVLGHYDYSNKSPKSKTQFCQCIDPSTCRHYAFLCQDRPHLKNKNKQVYFALSSTCPFTASAVKVGCTSRIKINKFILYSLRFALFTAPAVKVGCTSRIKINKFILYSLRFALPLDKVGVVSTMQIGKNICFFFALSSTCTTFVTY